MAWKYVMQMGFTLQISLILKWCKYGINISPNKNMGCVSKTLDPSPLSFNPWGQCSKCLRVNLNQKVNEPTQMKTIYPDRFHQILKNSHALSNQQSHVGLPKFSVKTSSNLHISPVFFFAETSTRQHPTHPTQPQCRHTIQWHCHPHRLSAYCNLQPTVRENSPPMRIKTNLLLSIRCPCKICFNFNRS